MISAIKPTTSLMAAFFWLSLELAAGRAVDIAAHLAFAEWALADVRPSGMPS